jgi:hypothetical protein
MKVPMILSNPFMVDPRVYKEVKVLIEDCTTHKFKNDYLFEVLNESVDDSP